jgi:hypothetical protein
MNRATALLRTAYLLTCDQGHAEDLQQLHEVGLMAG